MLLSPLFQVDQGSEFVEDVLDNIERFLAAKMVALRRNDSTNLGSLDVPTGGLALDFAKHTDPEVSASALRQTLPTCARLQQRRAFRSRTAAR